MGLSLESPNDVCLDKRCSLCAEMFVSSLRLCELEETFQIPGYTDSYAFTRASIVHSI